MAICSLMRRLTALALLGCALAASAATPDGLMPVRGDAHELVITPDGSVLALDRDGRPWRRRRQGDGSWAGLPGQFAALRAGLDGSVWGITAAHELYVLRSGSWWSPAGTGIDDVAAGPDGALLLRESGRGWRDEPASGRPWPADAASYPRALADAHGLPWLWRADGHIARYDGTAWQRSDVPDGRGLSSLSLSADGSAMLIDDRGAPWRWEPARRAWQALTADGAAGIVQVALGPAGKPWFVGADGRVLASDLFDAATPAARPPALFTRLLAWQRVRGQAEGLSIGADGTVLTLDREGSLWQWKGKNNWSMLPGQAARAAVAADGSVWAVLRGGRVAHQVRGFWQEAGFEAADIAAGARGDVWALRTDGQLALLVRGAGPWQLLRDSGGAVAIAVGKNGEPWIIDANGEVRSRPADAWRSHPGIRAVSLGVGPEGTVYATTAELGIYWLDPREGQWKPATGKALRIAVGPQGAPWAIGANSEVLASAFFLQEDERRVARQTAAQQPAAPVLSFVPAPPASVLASSNKPLAYTRVDGRYIDIGVGGDGSVFAVGSEGGLYCYNPEDQRFLLASTGAARRVATAAGATPWLVNAGQDVSYFDRGWHAVADFKASDIAVAQNGGVFAVEANSQQIYRYAAQEGVFTLARDANGTAFPKALKVAPVSNTMVWIIAPDQQVLRCTGNSCIAQGVSARDIGIGPEGSVMIVDLMGGVRRYDFKALAFKPAGGAARELSVGPQGLPWLVDAEGAAQAASLPKPSVRARATACNQRFSGQPVPMAQPPAQFKAGDDSAVLAPGGSVNILANDTVNGVRPVAAQVLVVFASATPYLAYADGLVTVLAGAPPGALLNASYKLCQLPTGSSCSPPATVTVAVPGTISAQPDRLSLAAGQATPAGALLANDAANGRPAAAGLVVVSGGFAAPGLAVTANGAVTVAVSVAPGSYAGSYQICLTASPATCAGTTVEVTVQAPQFVLAAPVVNVQLEAGRSTAAGQLLAGARLNGSGISAGMATASGQFAAAGLSVNADASVSVAAGTAAGNYNGNYRLCLASAPSNCAGAQLLVTVTAPPVSIAAQADNLTLAPGQTSAAGALLANDTLNGGAADPRLVTVSGSLGTAAAVINANGTIGVAADAPAGTYSGRYRVCAVAVPTACASAAVTLTVAPTVTAGAASVTINSGAGVPASTLLSRIAANGRAVQAGQVVVSASFAASGINVGTDGAIGVATGTAAGTYAGSYSACLSAQRTICATASLTVAVLDTVQAQADSFVLRQGDGGASILANDTISGQAVYMDQLARVTVRVSMNVPGISFGADGTISIASDAVPGNYAGSYRLCVAAAPANCSSAAISVVVQAAPVVPPTPVEPPPLPLPPVELPPPRP
ncbi:hypothetical protein [Rugamonas aquatica]|uniref:Uncharacterized protein n=1 Tax=Rugamonas aquatica TaxID=2743357 RepID=A0A6A7N1L0_9BURK|nr:hypothetical protein [Rugamonas aquatica]MQA38949.1 hypothetical protein [Rugamonas aquatica]